MSDPELRLNAGEVQRYVEVRFPHLKKSGAEYRGPCPIHHGKQDNFSINAGTGAAFCHSKCGRGWDAYGLELEMGGGDFGIAKEAVFSVVGRTVPNWHDRDIEATYDYTDASGKVLYQVVRKAGKKFSQRRPNGNGGWQWGIAGAEPVPYRLPDLIKSESVFIVEGEKDADKLSHAGLVATCNNGGAGNFKPALVPYFAGKSVVILPDNDETGRKHAESVAALLHPVAASVRVVHLPGLAEKGDVSDFLSAGGTVADLQALCRDAESWEPMADGTSDKPVAGPPKIRSVAEVCSIRTYAAQEIEWYVDGLLAAGTVTVISGESGSGKSTLVTDMASCIERGVPFAGMATRRRPVLFLDRENPLSVVVDRFNRLGVNDSPDFKYWGGWAPEEAPAPCSPIVLDWIAACDRPPLIVVDSLVAFLEGDENSATETRAYMNGFRRLADMGATVVVLHHSGKAESAKEYRGSSDIKASIDVGYHLSNMGDSSRLGTLRLKAFKARFSVQPEIVLHYVEGVGFRMDDRGPSLTVNEVLRDLLIENQRATATEFEAFAVAKGIASHKVRQFLSSGIEAGTIRADKGPRNTKHHVWQGSSSSESEGIWR